MSSRATSGSSMLFQSINDDLNASMATADELSKEFNSLLTAASSNSSTKSGPQSTSLSAETRQRSFGSSNGSSPAPFSPSSALLHSPDISSTTSPIISIKPPSSPGIHRDASSAFARNRSEGAYTYGQRSPRSSPRIHRRNNPAHYDRNVKSSMSYMERSPSPNATSNTFEHSSRLNTFSNQMGRRSGSPSHPTFNMSSTVPRNFSAFRAPDEGVPRQKPPAKWNETDLDASYERKPQHTYDKTEWLRPSVPNSNWRESNLDGPPPATSPKMDSRSHPIHSSLPRNARISVPPDLSSPVHSPYHPQPIISRISIPPASTRSHQRKPIPLSVIMRLQNPQWGGMPTDHSAEEDMPPYQFASLPREFSLKPGQQPPPEPRQPKLYSEVLKPGDVDAELERLDLASHSPTISEKPRLQQRDWQDPAKEPEQVTAPAPRPLSPTRLQPVVAPEAQIKEMTDLEELLRIRAEIPRALKRRGAVDGSVCLSKVQQPQPNQYKHLISKLFNRKGIHHRMEPSSESSSASEGEESHPPTPLPVPQMPPSPSDQRNYHSILRRASRERKSSGKRARLSPLVLLLDAALVGELDMVQRAVQEMSDPSQPNDEGITALHNAICGGHYNVVDFLVRIGANVSAPDSHGWTPLHCAASCNDWQMCEFLVRNGAAVMAMTESDATIASQKCDPYAVGFEECESFLKGMEEAMGVENSGVLYALWSFAAQAPDELSFKEGDMVTILQKPEGSDWWWASLCGREGFVPNNYFGLFPKVRPKSLC